MGMERVNLFFDNVYIDEFQDYRCEDYKFVIKLAKNVKSSYLFGDYYQNSVSATNNHGIPFNKGNTFEKFKKDLKKQGFTIDDTALIKSRRCTKDVCTFVRDNLNIQMYEEPSMKRVGIIKYIFDYKDLLPLINVSSIKIISINNERKWGSISIGLSKGNTYESTIVVIPDADIMLTENGTFRLGKIASPIVRNKIYVAITRATGTVYLTRSEVLDHAFGYI
jgi:DNA helicase-2/ATP-dependent DNA helicase PcrA